MFAIKKITSVLLCIMLITACTNEASFFEVKGNIANAKGKKVSLQWLTFGAKAPIILAEDTIKPNGRFIVRTPKNETQDIYILKIENGAEFYLINDVASISLKADIDNYKNYSTENSDASTQLHNFLNDYTKAYPTAKQAIFISDSMNNALVSDSIKNIYSQQKSTAVNNLNSIIKTYSANNTYAVIEAYLIAKAMATMPANDVKKLMNNANKKFPNNQHLKVLQVLLLPNNVPKKQPIIVQVDTATNDSLKKMNNAIGKPIKNDTAKPVISSQKNTSSKP